LRRAAGVAFDKILGTNGSSGKPAETIFPGGIFVARGLLNPRNPIE
jgi:hypothetical protein